MATMIGVSGGLEGRSLVRTGTTAGAAFAATFRAIAAIALIAGSAALTTATRAARRHHFLTGELAVAVLVQGLQSRARVGDFRGIDDSVMIGIERRDDRRRRTLRAAWRASGAGTTLRASGLRSLGRLGMKGKSRVRQGDRDDDEHLVHFHSLSFVSYVSRLTAVSREVHDSIAGCDPGSVKRLCCARGKIVKDV